MFRTNRFNMLNTNNDILVALVTNNLSNLKIYISKSNINNIIDTKNNYTSLHYAVILQNNDITKYLLDLGADPKIKEINGYDSYELSLRSNKKYIFEYFQEKQQNEIQNLKTKNNNLNIENKDLIEINEYNTKVINVSNDKILTLTEKLENKLEECDKLKYKNKDYEKIIEANNKTILDISCESKAKTLKYNELYKEFKNSEENYKRKLRDSEENYKIKLEECEEIYKGELKESERAFTNLLKKQKR